jgi:predicted permease
MAWIKRLMSSLRPRKLEADLQKELEFHLEMRARERTAAGATPETARRQALDRFGSITRTKEACRDESSLAWLAALRQDLCYSTRNIRKSPGFTAAATACLAVGIGANAAVFSFVNAFLFQSLPPGVVMVQRASSGPVSYPEYRDWQRLNHVFDDVFAYTPGERFTVGRGADTVPALGETVDGDYFRALNVSPAVGRLLASGDELRPLAVLGYHFWRNHFLADPAIAGKTIWIGREAFTVAGVAPASFPGLLAPWSTDVWVTSYLHRDRQSDRRMGWLFAAARLKRGVTPLQAEAAMNGLDAALGRQHPAPQRNPHNTITVFRRGGLSGSPVWKVFLAMAAVLMAVTGMIFLIACANVAGLLASRALARRREILIRLSLGASRSRLVRQFLTEGVLLCFASGAAGIALAFAAGDALAGLVPRSITGGFQFQHGIDLHVLEFTLAISIAAALVSGLLPALRASDQNLAEAGRSFTTAGGRTPRLRQGLIVAQVAASVLVLAIAGVFVRGFQKAQNVDAGFDAAHLLNIDLDLGDRKDPFLREAGFLNQLKARVGDIPGVASVAFADVFPLGNTRVVEIPSMGQVATAAVDPAYFRTMRIPLLRGHEPQPDERKVVIVNEAFARRLWPNQDPIGKSLALGSLPPQPVIGLAANSKYWELTESPRPFVYQVFSPPSQQWLCLAVRSAAAPAGVAPRIRQELQPITDRLLAVTVQTADERLRLWLQPQRAAALLLCILGFAALGLAIAGLYALLSQLVVQRSVEIAVRVTLGASPASLLGMLLRHSGLLIVAGTAAGLAAAAVVARLLASFAGLVNSLDALTVAAVAILLAAVGAAATVAPACCALRIDPASTLRTQ